jgi:TAG lipase / steryl ester hydrolase / phospholipase A2 / LPA acyltransferase
LHFLLRQESPLVPDQTKLAQLTCLRQAYGRTALLLSGGGTLGMNHVGVLAALFERNMLPRIISGTSAGSIVAGVCCTRTDDELPQILNDFIHGDLNVFQDSLNPETVYDHIARLLKIGIIHLLLSSNAGYRSLVRYLAFNSSHAIPPRRSHLPRSLRTPHHKISLTCRTAHAASSTSPSQAQASTKCPAC